MDIETYIYTLGSRRNEKKSSRRRGNFPTSSPYVAPAKFELMNFNKKSFQVSKTE